MFDTISFYSNQSTEDYFECVESSEKFMQDGHAITSTDTGEMLYNECKIRNFYVRVGRNWIYLSGSLPRLLYPDNTHVLTLQEVKKSLDFLSNVLHIDVGELPVTRIDIAGTFPMDNPVGEYLDCLGNLPRLKRIVVVDGESLYYRQGNYKYGRELYFYDKNTERMEKRGLEQLLMPTEIRGENLLRYEARWYGRLHKRFNVPEVKGKHLYDKEFYQMLVQEWADLYYSIEKKSVIAKDKALQQVKTVDDAKVYMFAKALQHAPVNIIEDTIQELKAKKTFKHSQDYSRLRKSIKQSTELMGMMYETEPAKELDEKVKAVVDGLTGKLS